MDERLSIAVPIDLDWPLKRHHEVFSGIQDYARQKAPHWNLVSDLYPAQWIDPADRTACYAGVVGRVSASDARAAERAGVPIVNVWLNSPVRDRLPSVLVDYVEVGRMAAEHLISRGLRRVGCVGYRRDLATRWFMQGATAVAREHDVPVSTFLTNFNCRSDEKNWHRFIDNLGRWIEKWSLPIGIAGSYDNIMRVLATECDRRGYRIPDEVALIGGNDDLMLCEGSEPALSSIDVGYYRVGYRAAELLDHLLRGGAAPRGPILSPPADLVGRVSTDVYAAADKTVARALRFIAEHCGEPISVNDVVAEVGCSRRSLEKRFRAQGRRTINGEIIAVRIELTKRLLVNTDESVESVAAQSGYGTAQHMRHVFRHTLGMSPLAYRRKHRKLGPETIGKAPA